ncbi:hypothetical protein B0T20DRAFT_152426 [Sordaria brevicollis]|uniref:Prolyl 4-hydroxylase alpha subunit Fe(2+) 2OG dioxygenase domain-containing protein n=1 Tax=Sordaria brevicollis TaxID=83679 RepID=A0AAE0PJ01_SORBR|nr:hypothetical protein B0T20DRAFT_152426 [Sordaria brevicollis]
MADNQQPQEPPAVQEGNVDSAPRSALQTITNASFVNQLPDVTEEDRNHESDPESVASELSSNGYKVNLMKDLCEALDNVKVAGSFASFRPLKETPPAGLHVDGIGPISMPLHETQARQLISKARQAPFGKGSETVVDTSVRNTWELDASQFTFTDPNWPGYLQSIINDVASDLGIINSPIRAEIYKMLLYERGAMFKSHTDTEKVPGMFGTLVVSLPSAHQGGDVVVKHCGEKKTFKTSDTTQSFITWYSDVHHEVLPVESGYRWVLTYNLALDPKAVRPSAGLVRDETRALRHTLRKWLREPVETRKSGLYYALDHEYTEASVRLNNLKTRDLAVGQVLSSLGKELGFEVFLTLLEKEEMGSCEWDGYDPWDRRNRWGYRGGGWGEDSEEEDDYGGGGGDDKSFHPLEDICDTTYSVKTVRDLEGRKVVESLPLDADDMLQVSEDVFSAVEPKEEYEGYMGNSGPQATHWYRISAILLVPSDSISSFFNNNNEKDTYSYSTTSKEASARSLIGYFARATLEYMHSHKDRATRYFSAVVELCDRYWSPPPAAPERPSYTYRMYSGETKPKLLDGKDLESAIQAAILLGNFEFLEKACSKHGGALPTTFSAWVKNWLKTSTSDSAFRDIRKGLTSAVEQYPYLPEQLQAVRDLTPSPEEEGWSVELRSEISEWADDMLKSCLNTSLTADKEIGSDDADTMIDMALMAPDPSRFLSTSVVPSLDPARQSIAFFISFLARLWGEGANGTIPYDNVKAIYITVAKKFIAGADLSKIKTETGMKIDHNKRRRLSYYGSAANGPTADELRTAISLDDLLDFYSTLIRVSTKEDNENGDGDLATQLITSLNAAVPRLPVDEMHDFWLPLLWSLIPLITANGIPYTTPLYQSLYRSILTRYINHFVGRQPVSSNSLIRPRVRCSCGDCNLLNQFLESPTRSVGRFAVNKARRQHLHNKLDGERIDCTHLSERNTIPHTLVVTKTFRAHDQRMKAWKQRKAYADGRFEMFAKTRSPLTPELRGLLGEEYDNIMGMRDAYSETATPTVSSSTSAAGGTSAAAPTPTPLESSSGNVAGTPAPVAGVKRSRDGVDVIDLTED